MKVYVAYHANCPDGFCSAWLLNSHLRYESITFFPCQYGKDPILLDENPPADLLLVVDFSFKRDILERLAKKFKRIVVLDHHITAQKELEELDYCIFDMNKSGAQLTYEWLLKEYPEDNLNIRYDKEFVSYIADRDLWKWELEGSKDFSAGLASYKMDFTVWNALSDDISRLINEGKAINRYRAKLIAAYVKRAEQASLCGYLINVVRCDVSDLISEVCEQLIQEHCFAATFFDIPQENKRVFSLRSRGDFDVSLLAKSLGGGGHKNAAGFTLPLN